MGVPAHPGPCRRAVRSRPAQANVRPSLALGNSALRTTDEARAAYIVALQAADQHDFEPLIAFLRS